MLPKHEAMRHDPEFKPEMRKVGFLLWLSLFLALGAGAALILDTPLTDTALRKFTAAGSLAFFAAAAFVTGINKGNNAQRYFHDT